MDFDEYCPDPYDESLFAQLCNLRTADSEANRKQQAQKKANNELCRRCRRVELNPKKLGMYYSVFLGSFAEVVARTKCPLCRLIVCAIMEVRRETHSDDSDPPFGINPEEPVELEWDAPSGFSVNLAIPGCHICFVEGDTVFDANEKEEVVRSARILDQPFIDPTMVGDWLWSLPTREVMEQFQSSFLASLSCAFRLIDVRSYTVVQPEANDDPYYEDEDLEYLALSYVWGRVHSLRLLEENQGELMKRGGLKARWDEIPQTVKDAIMLTRQLGKQYLWVDALCLVQDNPIDMLQGINLMDSIYKDAVLTIIAAAGSNANAGLPGVRFGTRKLTQPVEEIKEGVEMTITNSLDTMLDLSHYSGRAWTFQEQLFSQRTVIFTPNGGVYFRCQRAVWSEDTCDDESPSVKNYTPGHLDMALSDEYPPPLAFDALLGQLTQRSLSDQSDALNAMGGLAHFLSKRMKCFLLLGLPTAAFDFYLLFGGNSVTLQRRAGFPSWSWAGWVGHAVWCMRGWYMHECLEKPHLLSEWLEKRTWIIWYHRKGSENPRLVWDPLGKESSGMTNTDVCYRSRTPFDNCHVPHVDTSRTTPTENLHLPSPTRSYPLLQFWTLSVHLKISRIVSPDGPEFRQRGTIVDASGEFCGSVRLEGRHVIDEDLIEPFEFIVVSQCRYSMAGSEIDGRHEWLVEMRENPDGWDLYWVIPIQRVVDDVVVERRGLGQIYQKAVGTSLPPGPSWKEVVLG